MTTNPGYYFAVIAVGNLLGLLVLGRFFDTFGRKPMIAGTYIISGALLLITAYLFDSAAYLTVSEVFPMETSALAISFFYAIGTAAGGISGPLLLSSQGSIGKVSEMFLGVKAERRSLEDIATSLSAQHAQPTGTAG